MMERRFAATVRFTVPGVTWPGQEGTPLYNMSGRCVGQFSIINGDYSENGSCQFWNAAGDKIFGVYARNKS